MFAIVVNWLMFVTCVQTGILEMIDFLNISLVSKLALFSCNLFADSVAVAFVKSSEIFLELRFLVLERVRLKKVFFA